MAFTGSVERPRGDDGGCAHAEARHPRARRQVPADLFADADFESAHRARCSASSSTRAKSVRRRAAFSSSDHLSARRRSEVARAQRYRLGPGSIGDPDGTLVSARHFARVRRYQEVGKTGREAGARRRRARGGVLDPGWLVQPTISDDVDPAPSSRERRSSDLWRASCRSTTKCRRMRMANDSLFGLAAAGLDARLHPRCGCQAAASRHRLGEPLAAGRARSAMGWRQTEWIRPRTRTAGLEAISRRSRVHFNLNEKFAP